MGQIIGRTAKPDACNLRSLSSFGTPAAGQHILVSTDNSAMQNGQGNFDCYIVGDGTTAATALELKKIVDNSDLIENFIEPKLNEKVNKNDSDISIIRDNSDSFLICDGNGNVIFKVDASGLSTEVLKILNRLSIDGDTSEVSYFDNSGFHSQSIGVKYISYDDSSFVICDADGNVIFKVDENGLHTITGDVDYDIVFPSKLYCLDGVQRNIWHSSILSRFNPYDVFLRFEGTASYQRRADIVASLKTGNSDGKTMVVSMIDLRKMKKVKEVTSVLKVGTPNDSNLSAIKVQFIGSSTVQLAYFKYALENYVSNYTLIGMRHKPDLPNVKHEGRGGASLASYRSVSTGDKLHYYPFWQPNGNYRYYGATGFWLYAKENANSESESANSNGAYYNGCYNADILARFDDLTGFLTSPNTGDIMYDTANSSFKVYNGSSWATTTQTNYTWAFDYSKYLTMWGLSTPDVVCITLGANDFRNSELPLDFTTWNAQMDELITSIHAKSSSIKIVLCNQGPFGNHGYTGDPVPLQDYKMWLHLKDIIDTFDNRENENIYVLAQGSEISAEYGFRRRLSTDAITKPTEIFNGDERMVVLNQDTVHPYLSLDNMGTPIAAFLQYIRK
jgi:hypothetical protein